VYNNYIELKIHKTRQKSKFEMTQQPLEPRITNLENIISFMADTQRVMAENITKLTESQIELNRSQVALQQKQVETDDRFNVLLDELRYLSRRINE
jgi:hypothetical protein